MAKKNLTLDFLYLDLSTCQRCLETADRIDQTIRLMEDWLEEQSVSLDYRRIEISHEALARQHRFVTSPTIRLNGRDIQADFQETNCLSCGDLCGQQVDCRSWHYRGKNFSVPPLDLLSEAIEQAVTAPSALFRVAPPAYHLPDNLKTFFKARQESAAAKKDLPDKPAVAFICVHNSCRSQMAEALSKLLAADVFRAYSAGTELMPEINQTAVRIIRQNYGVDMNQTQYSKLIDELPEIDIVVTMGCNVICPYIPSRHQEDWGLADPTGQPDEVFIQTARVIESKVTELARRIAAGEWQNTATED